MGLPGWKDQLRPERCDRGDADRALAGNRGGHVSAAKQGWYGMGGRPRFQKAVSVVKEHRVHGWRRPAMVVRRCPGRGGRARLHVLGHSAIWLVRGAQLQLWL